MCDRVPVLLPRSVAPSVSSINRVGGNPTNATSVDYTVTFSENVSGVDTEGLGEWPGIVDELQAPVLPHMGWNTVDAPADSVLFEGIRDERFYFVHSYAARDWTLDVYGAFAAPRVTWADHGGRFVAAAENGPLSATQFRHGQWASHPPSQAGRGEQVSW